MEIREGPAGWARGVLGRGRPMNEITFGTKRAFQGFVRFTRKPLATMGLTAARFDMMWALLTPRHLDMRWPWKRQSDVRRWLGVSAPVVSRMLKALEALGLVVREREEKRDRRQIRVRLTEAGERCIRAAGRVMIRAMRRLVFEAICFGAHRDPNRRLINMDALEGYLRSLRKTFGDTARLSFPWGHPDD